MPLDSGERLGPYEIIEPIGKGGMGEVYRVRDTRLGRDVALKVSAEEFGERFEREARAVASLNHPNVCTLHDVGPNYLVMELVEGPTLAERIHEGPIPLGEALAIARQIADALESAHDKGITHRDLKPGNIKIKADGTVKVLDFGLAKVGTKAAGAFEDSPTMSMHATQAGVILGTAAYMAPEQARGKDVDKRSDIWAFGVVLYEMVTGKRLFQGEDLTDTLASVVKIDPDISDAPPQLHRLLKKCLEKDPKKRLRDISSVELLLEAAVTAEPVAAAPQARSTRFAWTVAAVAIAVAIAFGILSFRSSPNSPGAPEVVRLIVPAPNGEALASGAATDGPVAVSPDGRYLTFTTISPQTNRRRLWIRTLASLDARPLEATDDATFPFWSHDSKFIAFSIGGELKKVEVANGNVRKICEAGGRIEGGTWNDRDEIVFAASRLFRVSASGGTPTPVTTLVDAHGETAHRWPQFLPDGRHFLFFVQSEQKEVAGQYVGSVDSSERTRVLDALGNAAYANGFLLYRGELPTLMAQQFDPATLKLQGEPILLLDDIARPNIDNRHTHFSVSQNGVLAYQPVPLPGTRLAWFDRTGKRLSDLRADGELYVDPEISLDGRYVAVDRIERKTGRIHIVLIDVNRGTMTRLNPELTADARPIWSRDSSSLVFSGESGGRWGLFRKPRDAAAPSKSLTWFPYPLTYPTDWSADTTTVLLLQIAPPIGTSTLRIQDGSLTRLVDGGFLARLSPDGNWLAYASLESGREEIYVRSMSGTETKRPVSNGGGTNPHWRGDGRELFYAKGSAVMAVDVRPGAALELGVPRRLFDYPTFMNSQPAPTPRGGDFTVDADGQRFLLDVLDETAPQSPITVVLNWTATLKK